MSEPRIIKVHESINHLTVQEVVDFCLQRDLDMSATKLTGGHLAYERPETDKERARREAWEAESERRKNLWELETYDRLRAKFGTADA